MVCEINFYVITQKVYFVYSVYLADEGAYTAQSETKLGMP